MNSNNDDVERTKLVEKSQINYSKAEAKGNIKKDSIEKLIEKLRGELRSPPIRATPNENSNRCLIRFHNCTPYKITPFWIDHRGLAFEYTTLNFATSLNLDTYVSHLWLFRAEKLDDLCNGDHQKTEPKKILAVPEETLDFLWKEGGLSTNFIDANYQPLSNEESNCSNLCALCKYVKDCFSREPTKTICPHYTGEAKFSHSGKSCQGLCPSYIYTCDGYTHKPDHATKRRNIYLVEPFFSLRERCFLTLEKHINDTEIVGLDLPVSLQREYLRFRLIIQKLNRNK